MSAPAHPSSHLPASPSVSSQQDIDLLVEMLREASQSRDAKQVLASFARRLWVLNPIDGMVSLSVRSMPQGHYKVTRLIRREDIDFASKRELPDPWRDWDSIPAHATGFLADVIAAGSPQLFSDLDLSNDPVLGDRLADMRACIATPLFDAGQPLNWNLQFRSDPRGFTDDDLAAHVLQANLIGSITRSLIAVKREADLKVRLQQQLDELASVQQSLLPRTTPDVPGLKLAASYLTSDEAGGDYYDFVPLPNGQWGFLIADVAGHGAAAAAIMAMLHAIVHSYQGELTAAGIVRYANQRLCESSIEGRFATAFFGQYDPTTSTLSYIRAGHNPPKLKRADGSFQDLEGGATLPLGVLPDLDPKADTVTLEPGDTLVLYTDGITEAFDASRQLFGVERLDEALRSCACNPEDIIDSVHRALHQHTNRLDRDDDQTIVVIQRTHVETTTQ